MPETGSKVLRRIIEALFITHAETKLNSASNLVKTNKTKVSMHDNVVWCEGLVRRPLPSFTRTATTKNIARSKN